MSLSGPATVADASLIDVSGLRINLGGRTILHDVDLTMHAGEIVTVVGPNGSGKSTLLRALVGALKPAAGKIVKRSGLKLGYVPQSLKVGATMPLTVGRFMCLPRPFGSGAVGAALGRVGVPDLSSRQMTELSGGQFQRVLLARAILPEPDLLLLDEPTQALDQPATAAFYRLIEDLKTELDCAVLMVSHDLHVVMSASDRVLCVNGHICCEGTPERVSSAPEYRALFGYGTQGALALYRHTEDHSHDPLHAHDASHQNATDKAPN